jgi:hypothetical protein
MPDTICIEERLPPGTTAVHINRTHTYTGPLPAGQCAGKKLFEAIDSERSIGEIVGDIIGDHANHEIARDFFERLWRYDQVVVDASGTTMGKSDVTGTDL